MTDLIYIMSPSYSGSTLLTLLLADHPAIATVGELKATSMGDIEEYVCSCGTKIRRCRFWQQVAEELDRQGVRLDLEDFGTHFRSRAGPLTNRLLRAAVRGAAFEMARDAALKVLPGPRRALREILAKNQAVIETITRLQQRPVFLDGSKDPIRLKHLRSAGQWNIRTVYLIRDGRGAAHSYMKHYSTSMGDAAREWRATQEECDRMASRLPEGSWIKVRYEQLCGSPDDTMVAIFRFLKLDPALASRDAGSMEHHILGNAMRLRSSSKIRLDEKWKTGLKPDDLATFDQLAGDLNRRYGYA